MQAQALVKSTPLRVDPSTKKPMFNHTQNHYHHHPLSPRAAIISAVRTTSSPPKREIDLKKRVVITGMGVVSVFENDVKHIRGLKTLNQMDILMTKIRRICKDMDIAADALPETADALPETVMGRIAAAAP
ncbi:3-oxoacyl-[acyl-carrier-protein] synthase 2 [Artemisia annua]|uniref:3-oxoacyl-[acyl-carrier-protein] synthase 2 n=1 Tax=Artemisia annua TaxID=35608 RepID=A0A2U1QN60_ARTAN|nr:3-oxoacyl-[acyl-carrier-protein] synthase 2 [Artemisia annua]